MNPYQILELILEELADGRQEGESIIDYKKRKAGELEKLYNDREDEATMIADNASKRADKLKGKFKQTKDLKDAEGTFDLYQKAAEKRTEAADAQRKGTKAAIIRMNTIMKNEELELMEEIIKEVTPLETKRRIANQFKDKMNDKVDAASDEVQRSLDKMNALDKKIRKQGGDTVVVTGDKIDKFSDKPEVKKDQEAFNKATDDMHKASKKEHKMYNLRNLVNFYKTNEALDLMEEILNVLDEDELHDQKARRRNAEKNAKGHAYKAKQFERRSDKAIEQGKERKAEALYDKANTEWDKETAEQDRAAKAHHKVEELRYGKESINCALDLMEQIVDFADNLFELDLEQKQNISPNKVSRVKKDKNGEKVEVVSVADELFPYEGDAKQQFNQKVLAKINDMIEGTGSLEDLIQFVRKGVATKKQAAHEAIDEEKDPVYTNPISKELRGEKGLISHHADEMEKYGKRADGATGYRRQVNLERAADAERAVKDASKKFRKHKGEILDYFRNKGDNNVEAHKKLSRMMGAYEALEEIKSLADSLFEEKNNIDTALGSPVKKKLANIKAKMTDCKETKVHEALDLLEEIINELKITDRALKKVMNDKYKKAVEGEKKYHEEHGKFTDKWNSDVENKSKDFTYKSNKEGTGRETDVDQEVRLYPEETKKLQDLATPARQNMDRYLRLRDRYNKRHPILKEKNKFKSKISGFEPESTFALAKKSKTGKREQIYTKPVNHWGNGEFE